MNTRSILSVTSILIHSGLVIEIEAMCHMISKWKSAASGLESVTTPQPELSMRFSPNVLLSCLVAISLFGCAEQPQAKMEVKEAAKLPTKLSKKRAPKPRIEAAKRERALRPISD